MTRRSFIARIFLLIGALFVPGAALRSEAEAIELPALLDTSNEAGYLKETPIMPTTDGGDYWYDTEGNLWRFARNQASQEIKWSRISGPFEYVAPDKTERFDEQIRRMYHKSYGS